MSQSAEIELRTVSGGEEESHTDDMEIAAMSEGSLTQAYGSDTRKNAAEAGVSPKVEANVILIAHPDHRRLGSRYRLSPGASLGIGRNPNAAISLPEVLSISRDHARLEYVGDSITLVDLGSTNGTYVNGELVDQPTPLKSGDRFQVAAVHFKLLHEEDVEHAYYEAIYDLVMRDGLTEIYNKRKYLEEAEREVSRALRHGRPLCLVIFDLDDFKRINDDFGHLCGDFVLKRVVTRVAEVLRPEQVFARVGGDEFVILTPETSLEGAEVLAAKLRDSIAELDYFYCDFRISVTCSFGVAGLDEETRTLEDLFVKADTAMLKAKRNGNKAVEVHPAEN